MDLDSKPVQPDEYKDVRSESSFKGKISKNDFLNRLRQVLKNQKDDDKLVLSLKNHGGPARVYEKGISCIMLSASEKICDNEIAELIQKTKPKGKFAVIADGCFSGGFVQLASQKVCVATVGDQYTVSSSPQSLWSLMNQGKVTRFSDIQKESLMTTTLDGFFRPKNYFRAGSFTMNTNSCESIQEKLLTSTVLNNNKVTELNDRLSLMSQSCQRDAKYLFHGIHEKQWQQMANAFEIKAIQDMVCKADDVELQKSLAEVCEKLKKINDFFQKDNRWMRLLKAYVDDYNKSHEKNQYLFMLRSSFQSEAFEIILKNLEIPTSKKFKRYWSHGDSYYEDLEKHKAKYLKLKTDADEAKKTLDAELSVFNQKLKESNLLEDIEFIRTCLIPPDMLQRPGTSGWEAVAKMKKRPRFKAQEIEEAKKCEDSFTFN